MLKGILEGTLVSLLNCGGAVAAWLVHSSSDQVVQVLVWAGDIARIAFLSKTLCSNSAPLFPGALMGTGELNAG